MIPLIEQLTASNAVDYAIQRYTKEAERNSEHKGLAQYTHRQMNALPSEEQKRIQQVVQQTVQRYFSKKSMLMSCMRKDFEKFLDTSLVIPSRQQLRQIRSQEEKGNSFKCFVGVDEDGITSKIYGLYFDASITQIDLTT